MPRPVINKIDAWVDELPARKNNGTINQQAPASSTVPTWVLSLLARPGHWALLTAPTSARTNYQRSYPSVELANRNGRLYARWPEGAEPWWES